MNAKTLTPAFLALVLAAPLLSPAPLAAAPPAADGDDAEPAADKLLLTHAKLAVGDGTVIEDASILIEDGKIAAVQKGGLADTAGATTLDLGGKLVTPGLIAADTNLGLVEIGLEDSTRDDRRKDEHAIKAGYNPAPAVNADSSLIAVQAVEGVTTAAVAPRGGLISGEVAWIDLLPGEHTKIVAAPGVAVAANYSFAGSRAAALAELRRALEDADWYRKNQKAYDKNQARELAAHPKDLRALGPVLDKTIPLVVRAHRAGDLLALVELAEEFDLELTLVGATEAWKVADELAKTEVPLTVVIQPSQNLPGSFDTLGARLDNAALLHKAGVRVAIAHFDSHNARNMTQEAGIAVANGLDPAAALQAITLNVARAYAMEDRYGSVAPGKVASLVVWDGDDPFELSTWPARVFVAGRELELESRQTELRDRYMELDAFAE